MKIVLKIGNDTGFEIDVFEKQLACEPLKQGQLAAVEFSSGKSAEILIGLHPCTHDNPGDFDLSINVGKGTEIQEIHFGEMKAQADAE